MMKKMKKNYLMKLIYQSFINLPTPSNISSMWNFGSLLGLCLMIQFFTGIFLAMYYCPNTNLAFNSIIHICRDVNYGWLLRTLHSNGASFFFICMYAHIGRNLYYGSYKFKSTWMSGVTILMMTMATAFFGYVLPWGQMSFWGATVITNLISVIPYLGNDIVTWIWGGFAVSNVTLNRFFVFHFMTPFFILGLMFIHLMFLHQTGSNNPLGTNSNVDKIPFHPYFTIKDFMGFIIMMFLLILLTLQYPYYLSDPDNFIPANPMITPIHIQPEWYFLFAYAILRSIPSKLGGVIALISSVMIFYIVPFMPKNKFMSNQFYPINKLLFWMFVSIIFLLTWIGARPVEAPYMFTSQILSTMYFLYFLINLILYKLWDLLIFKT